MTPCTVATLTMNPALDLSAEVEAVEPIHKLRCASPRRDPGGGGINVARVMSRLGGSASAIFPAGGMTGGRLEELLRAEGVHSVSVEIAGETREDVTILEKRSGRQYRFVMPGPTLSEKELTRCLEALRARDAETEFVVVSGSLPPSVTPDFYAEIARHTKSDGRKLIVDTSGAGLRAVLEVGAYLVKPNLRELEEYFGNSLTGEPAYLAAAQEVVTRGAAQIVALSLAEKGARLVTRDGAWRASAPPISPVSTVGAGDSFVGAFVCALARREPLPEALRWGVAAGTAALLSHGTELCQAADVNRLLPQVLVEKI